MLCTITNVGTAKGYPTGLAGEQIPLPARIVAIADVYEALSSRRSYKPAFSHEKCVAVIREQAGTQFDPELVEVFVKIESQFRKVARQYGYHMPQPSGPRPSGPVEPIDQKIGKPSSEEVLGVDQQSPLAPLLTP